MSGFRFTFVALFMAVFWPFLLSSGALGAQQTEGEVEAKVRAIASELRCPVCQNLSVADSPSGLAQEMRDLIRERLLQGQSEEQVKAYFVGKYGEWVLLAPPRKGFNLLAWILPFFAVLGGLGGIIVALRRWVGRRKVHRQEGRIAPEYQERLSRELEEFDA